MVYMQPLVLRSIFSFFLGVFLSGSPSERHQFAFCLTRSARKGKNRARCAHPILSTKKPHPSYAIMTTRQQLNLLVRLAHILCLDRLSSGMMAYGSFLFFLYSPQHLPACIPFHSSILFILLFFSSSSI